MIQIWRVWNKYFEFRFFKKNSEILLIFWGLFTEQYSQVMQSNFEEIQEPSGIQIPGPGSNMCENNNTQSIADYLAQLLKDKKQLAAFPNVFLHLERLLDDGKK